MNLQANVPHIAITTLAICLLFLQESHAGAITDAYNAGFKKGYEVGRSESGGGGTQNNIVLNTPQNGGFTEMLPSQSVGFYFNDTAKEWQAYRLEKDAPNTITPGTGLSMSEWGKKPEIFEKHGININTVTPQLEAARKAISENHPNANIWISP